MNRQSLARTDAYLKMGLIAGVSLILLGVIWAFWLQHNRQEYALEERAARQQTADLCHVFEEHASRTIGVVSRETGFLKRLYEETGRSRMLDELTQSSRHYQGELYNLISFINREGMLTFSSLPGAKKVSVAERPFFKRHKANPSAQLLIGAPVLGRATGKWYIPMSRRLNDKRGGFGGVILASVNPHYFSGYYRSVDVGRHGLVLLCSTEHGILTGVISGDDTVYRLPAARTIPEAIRWADWDTRTEQNTVYFDGHPRVYSYQRVRGAPLVIVTGVSMPDRLAGHLARKRIYTLTALLASAVVLVFSALSLLLLHRDGQRRRELESREELFRTTAQAVPEALVMIDSQLSIRMWNTAADALFGWNGRNVLGEDLFACVSVSDPVDVLRHGLTESLNLPSGVVPGVDELTIIRPDGQQAPIELSVVRTQLGGQPFLVLMWRDLTESRRAERQRLEYEREQARSRRFESLARMAGGIAHDFNNLLMVVIGNADLVKRRLNASSPALSHLNEVDAAAHRASELCRQMLACTGQTPLQRECVDLSMSLRQQTPELAAICDPIPLHMELPDGLPCALVDVEQMRTVWRNLVANAAEAMKGRQGGITVSVSLLKNPPGSGGPGDLDTMRYLRVQVQDQGVGMDKQTLERVFEPFFSTKFTGRGLGMATVQGIVQAHEGHVSVQSTPGQGTTVDVLLPVPDEASDTCRPAEGSSAENRLICVVDDEEMIRELATEMLDVLGYRSVCAASGEEAIALYRERGAEIALVLLDLTMPGMNGEQTFAALKALDPQVRVVLTSGYSESQAAGRFVGHGLAGFLHKPYDMDQLEACLNRALG